MARGTVTPFLFLLISILSVSACSDDVNPFIGTELPYSVWGNINPRADTQAVRVFLIEDVLRLVSSDPIDANVRIINTDTDTRYILQDSIIQLDNGDFRHIFWSEINVDHHETYRLEVERSDGQLTKSSDVTVPGPILLEVVPANTNAISELIQQVRIDGNPPSLPRIDVIYNAFTVNTDGIRQVDNPVTIDYSNQTRLIRDSLFIEMDLRLDFRRISEDFASQEVSGFICLDNVTIEAHVGNEEWRSPIGSFDPNFLVEPGTLTNIDNGFGFFGAGYVERIVFNPPDLLLVRAGFFDCVAPGTEEFNMGQF